LTLFVAKSVGSVQAGSGACGARWAAGFNASFLAAFVRRDHDAAAITPAGRDRNKCLLTADFQEFKLNYWSL